MEGTPEQPKPIRTRKEHRSWGELESVEEIVTDEFGREVEKIERDPDGNLLSHVRYVRDADGRLMQEEWVERKGDGTTVRGRYVYQYDNEGRQIDKVWELEE